VAKANSKVPAHKRLTVADVHNLGRVLIETANRYPLSFRTERDFYPLIAAYVQGRVPTATPEYRVEGGAIDFRFGGTNPALLEVALAPRAFKDHNLPGQTFPGHGQGNQLYASQNKNELKKLSESKPRSMRFLLLVDFQRTDRDALRKGYEAVLPPNKGHRPVHVVYVSQQVERGIDFTVGGKKRGRRRAA